ncbi:hypothetical protein N7454_003829 [Penicillium verhagenii]|nr:hypothetical protein N7454_003829 [Penicillium verhagenii]
MSAEDHVQLHNFGSIFSLEGKVAVVTGGSTGLGLHSASGLLQAGCSKVFISAENHIQCEKAVTALNALPGKHHGAMAISVPADCSKVSEIERLATVVQQRTNHVDILLVNAGTSRSGKFDTFPESAFNKVMDLNVKSVFYTVQKFAALLKAKASMMEPSRVIVTTSISGIVVGGLGLGDAITYSISKAAVIHLTKNLAVALGPRYILCNAVAPGVYPSRMTKWLIEINGMEEMAARVPNGRLGKPEDIAGLVVFLSSRASSHLNGAVITTDGGSSLKWKM